MVEVPHRPVDGLGGHLVGPFDGERVEGAEDEHHPGQGKVERFPAHL